MTDEIKSTSNGSNLENRIQSFRDCMEPAMSLLPGDIIERLKNNGFFTAPASTKYHGAYEGGLFVHSIHVTNILLDLTEDCHLLWSRPESPYIIGMFHDICKRDLYRHPFRDTVMYVDGKKVQEIDTDHWEHNPEVLLKGHGDRSVMLLSEYLHLTMEEILCIRYHMGAFVDKAEWGDYTAAIHKYPNVLWTHHADMIASHIVEIDK